MFLQENNGKFIDDIRICKDFLRTHKKYKKYN